jgi:hypothetical protein
MAQTKKESLFVKVPEPKSLRINILESSKDILGALTKYEVYKKTREEKKVLLEKVRHTLKEVSKTITVLRNSLPKINIKEVKPIKQKLPAIKPQAQAPMVIKPRKKSELERLESELAAIESKINSIA